MTSISAKTAFGKAYQPSRQPVSSDLFVILTTSRRNLCILTLAFACDELRYWTS